MMYRIAERIDLFVHGNPERRDLSSLWKLPFWKRSIRLAGVVLLDFFAMYLSFALILSIFKDKVEIAGLITTSQSAMVAATASLMFLLSGMYRRSWRFVSFADNVFMAIVTFVGLAIGWSLLIPMVQPTVDVAQSFSLALLHFCLTIIAMQLMRAARRAGRSYKRRQQKGMKVSANDNVAKTALLVGEPEWAMSVLDMFRTQKDATISVTGLLLPSEDKTISQLSKVPVLGGVEDFNRVVAFLSERNRKPDLVIVCDDGTNISVRDLAQLNNHARKHQVEVVKLGDPASQLLRRRSRVDLDNLPLSELLGRKEHNIEHGVISRQISGHCVLVTGAGGTIGSELVMQLAGFKPSKIVLLDHSEYHLYAIEMRLKEAFPELDVAVELCSIRDSDDVRRVFARHLPSIVYHAAALKHVPMVEANPLGGIHTNIIGTRIIANAVCEYAVRAMVQVSTDKAVNPVGMMGSTKRVGELYCQSLDLCGVDDTAAPRFMTVRFGNVLGSSGSIVPLFKRQLLEGKPLTVTHPDIERFFMTVGEAVQLILESSSRSLEEETVRGNIFVLDMGAPVKIVDLAKRMARIYGLEPDVDVPIQFVGLRPGEKLYEELFDSCEHRVESGMPGLFEACSSAIPLPLMAQAIDQLEVAVREGKQEEACLITDNLVRLPSSGVDMTTLFGRAPTSWRGQRLQLVKEIEV